MEALIRYQGVSILQEDRPVIGNVDLTVTPGEFIYLLGRTGSGKSSFLKTIYADIPVKNGTAQVCGFDLLNIRSAQIPFLRRKLGIVFQDFQLLFDRSVHQNLRFVMKATGWKDSNKINERVSEVMKRSGIDGMEKAMPHELSAGEQQRVVIARSLLNDPEIILADEPTGNLDPQTSEEILNLLRGLNKTGKTILFATHDMMLYNKFSARTLYFEKGSVIERR
jgi:cell division transport system ATP-binding protein